jgi:hypothetical protein
MRKRRLDREKNEGRKKKSTKIVPAKPLLELGTIQSEMK